MMAFRIPLVSTIIPSASIKAAAVEEGVPEPSSHKHSVYEMAVNELGTKIPILCPLKSHILKCDIFETSVMKVHVLESNILEVRIPHKTVVEVFPLKTTVLNPEVMEPIKMITEVPILVGYHSCKEIRRMQDPKMIEWGTRYSLSRLPDTCKLSV